jgi:hypothetical protein
MHSIGFSISALEAQKRMLSHSLFFLFLSPFIILQSRKKGLPLFPCYLHGRSMAGILGSSVLGLPFKSSSHLPTLSHSCIRVIFILSADYHSLAVSLTCPVLLLPEIFLLSCWTFFVYNSFPNTYLASYLQQLYLSKTYSYAVRMMQ